jgi:hypothetical protein
VEKRLDCRQACLSQRSNFRSLSIGRRRAGLRVAFRRRIRRSVRVDVLRVSRGRRVLKPRQVISFRGRRRSFRWNGQKAGRPVPSGLYVVRARIGRETRRLAFVRRRGRFKRRPAFARSRSCDALSAFRLSGPAFGGSRRVPLRVAYRLSRPGAVTVVVRRGRRVVRRVRSRTRAPGRTYRLAVRPRRAGEYRVTLTARSGGRSVTSRLGARRLR